MSARLRLISVLLVLPLYCRARTPCRFQLGPGAPRPGWTRVLPSQSYRLEEGYGYLPGVAAPGAAPGFYFAVREEPGNYDVAVTVGDPSRPSVTTIKAELRRLIAGPIRTAAGQSRTIHFAVNLRVPRIAGDGRVRLKPREKTGEIWDWDRRLELEFDGAQAAVETITITPAGHIPTLYIAGDSTVCDQPYEPYASWGQMFTDFFGPGVAVANHAESGESLDSFIGERRLAKLDTLMRPGDYLFIQSGHNDQKEHGPGKGPFQSYTRDLERMIDDARAHGTTPVLITPLSRRTFGPQGRIVNSLGEFPAAMRAVAGARHTAVIDLNAMSETLYDTLGPGGASRLFPVVHGAREKTHTDDFGAYEVARCVVTGVMRDQLPIVRYLRPWVRPYDPRHPDNPADFAIPPSPRAAQIKPYGD
ncbi:MAG: rhamnogalacturonan acetylesterase [Opitutaceae bacterium]